MRTAPQSLERRIRRVAACWARTRAMADRAKARQAVLLVGINGSDGDVTGTTLEKVRYHVEAAFYVGTVVVLDGRLHRLWTMMSALIREAGARMAICEGQVYLAWTSQEEAFDLLHLADTRAETAVLNFDDGPIGRRP